VILFCAATEREMDACLAPLGAPFRELLPAVMPISANALAVLPGRSEGEPRARMRGGHLFAVTGVGIPMTLARLMPLASALRPELIVNVGIAGAYPETDIAIGYVVTGSHESFGDIGVELPGLDPFAPISGFPWADPEYRQPLSLAVAAYPRSEDLFPESRTWPFPIRMARGCTVNRCTGLEATGRRRRDAFGAEFESMEGAAAALAGMETGIPVCEVRAISNLASTRDMRPENIAQALGNLGVYMARWLESLP
jgi:futalosine hydrolase